MSVIIGIKTINRCVISLMLFCSGVHYWQCLVAPVATAACFTTATPTSKIYSTFRLQ